MPEVPSDPPKLHQAMPRPVLVVFGIAALVGLVAVAILLIRPPRFDEVALGEVRPPPSAPYSHDPVRVFAAPTPEVEIPYDPPCEEVSGSEPVGGVAFVRRVTDALEQICTLRGASIDPDVLRAVRGLGDATIRIAEFTRSGIESTLDVGARTIWVNLKLTRRDQAVAPLIPVLLHDGFHLATADEAFTAERELRARAVELAGCRTFIRPDDWPRWCTDAQELLARDDALEVLVAAGFVSDAG